MVGNGITYDESDTNSVPPFLYNHALIPQKLYQDGILKCKGDYYKNQKDTECNAVLTKMYNTLWSSGINPYDIYGKCETSSAKNRMSRSNSHPLFNMWNIVATMGGANGAPCINDTAMSKYFNVTLLNSLTCIEQQRQKGCSRQDG